MDESRIFRVSISGGICIFSILFHYWILGGDFNKIKFDPDEYSELIGIIIIVISSPALGYIISTIAVAVLHFLFSYRLHFFLPKEMENRLLFYSNLISIVNSTPTKNKLLTIVDRIESRPIPKLITICNGKYKKDLKDLYQIFILAIRILNNEQITNHVVRLWNTFWTHINNIAAIFWGLFFAIVLRNYFDESFKSISHYEFSPELLIFELPIILYVLFAIWHLINSRNLAIDLENLCLSEIKS